MVSKRHSYQISVSWTGNRGEGTSGYRAYDRSHEVTAGPADQGHDSAGRVRPQPIAGSSDPAFRGDPDRWNPEQLLTASLAQCHMLWYLHLCAVGGVVVTDYADNATGTMTMDVTGGGGQFTEVTLHPAVTVADPSMVDKAQALHEEVDAVCFIARSINFLVRHEPTVRVAPDA